MVDEMDRAEAARDEIQRARAQLTRIGEEVQDRASGILADATMLIDEVMEVVQSPVQEGCEDSKNFLNLSYSTSLFKYLFTRSLRIIYFNHFKTIYMELCLIYIFKTFR